jgi:tungstate transport system substrate-binding protein
MGIRWLLALLVVAALAASASGQPGGSGPVILATTTSTQDSGLLDVLVPMFERASGYTVKTVAVGTGQSLAMGARGEADVVLVHAPKLEMKYVESGDLINRRLVMHNDFIIVGPKADPAGAKSAKTAAEAMKAIAGKAAAFVSRGDNSGTHVKERALWKAAGVTPARPWYIESGQGMGATLTIASERQAYALTDRATYLAFSKRVDLPIVLEGDAPLLNVYHVMEVSAVKHPKINAAGGKAFADFMVSAVAQSAIRTFGVAKYGQPLFFPDAGKPEPPIEE